MKQLTPSSTFIFEMIIVTLVVNNLPLSKELESPIPCFKKPETIESNSSDQTFFLYYQRKIKSCYFTYINKFKYKFIDSIFPLVNEL